MMLAIDQRWIKAMTPNQMRTVKVLELSSDLPRRGSKKPAAHTLLMQDDKRRQFRIPVGPCEALGIRVMLHNELVPRPITHDLIVNVIERLGAEVDHVVIDRAGNGCRAKIMLNVDAGSYVVEANHGDAIALALRTNAIIYATEELIESGEHLI